MKTMDNLKGGLMIIPVIMLSVLAGIMTFFPVNKPEPKDESIAVSETTHLVLDNPESYKYKIGKINWKKVKQRR